MKPLTKLSIICLSLSLSLGGCSSSSNSNKKKDKKTDRRDIKYYAEKTVSSLKIPPDLTKPNSQNAFKLSEYAPNIANNPVNFSATDKIDEVSPNVLTVPSNIVVKKSGDRRWLVVDKKPEKVWELARSFLKSNGFAIEKSNKEVGIMETNFLENHPEIPDQSLGLIRSLLRKAIKTKYTLPVADKYRIRIEPVTGGEKSTVYLSLSSMEEVLTDVGGDQENTIWQSRPKDTTLETEMLYRLMVFLGGDHAVARDKILQAKEEKNVAVKQVPSVNGYTKLVFSLNQYDTWDNVGWALDQLSVEVDDKDVKEGSFYINTARTKDRGILSRIFGDIAIKKSFQILVRQVRSGVTEVYFNDLSEENEQKTIDFSREFLASIAKQF